MLNIAIFKLNICAFHIYRMRMARVFWYLYINYAGKSTNIVDVNVYIVADVNIYYVTVGAWTYLLKYVIF